MRALAMWAILLATGTSLAACAGGAIRSESDAIAAAERLSGLRGPIKVLDVTSGKAGEIFNGPPGSTTDATAAAAAAKRARPAWRVDLQGFAREPCADTAYLSCGLINLEFVIDRDTGEVLYSMEHG